MQPEIIYHWDFDFQGKFEIDVPENQLPYLAIAGGILHDDIYCKLTEIYLKEGAIELSRKQDFTNRDKGFSRNRAIRGQNLKTIKVFDKKKGKPMMAMPDIVDYRNDLMIDLKTYYLRTPPDKGGKFITIDDVSESETLINDPTSAEFIPPEGYEVAWFDLKEKIQKELEKKYMSQFERYHQAYIQSTNRIPTIHIYVVLYTVTETYEHDDGYRGMKKLDT